MEEFLNVYSDFDNAPPVEWPVSVVIQYNGQDQHNDTVEKNGHDPIGSSVSGKYANHFH